MRRCDTFLRTAASDGAFEGAAAIIKNLKTASHLSDATVDSQLPLPGIMIALETDKCAECNQARQLAKAGLFWEVQRSLGGRPDKLRWMYEDMILAGRVSPPSWLPAVRHPDRLISERDRACLQETRLLKHFSGSSLCWAGNWLER